MPHPKIRGVRRHCTSLALRLSEQTQSFPTPHDGRGYWHLHLPVAQSFIDSPRTRQSIRQACAQILVDAGSRLLWRRPASNSARVVVAVTTPRLFDSQLIAFFSEDYFASFFQRCGPDQFWTPLPAGRSLSSEWGLSLPSGFSERGFHAHIHDEDQEWDGEVWFFGELP